MLFGIQKYTRKPIVNIWYADCETAQQVRTCYRKNSLKGQLTCQIDTIPNNQVTQTPKTKRTDMWVLSFTGI